MLKEGIYQRLGCRIREIRKDLGMTQEELAFRAKITPSFLSHIERGKKKASLRTVENLAHGLGVTLDRLCVPDEETARGVAEGTAPYGRHDEEERFLRRFKALIRDKGSGYRRILWRVARYLAEKEKRDK